MNAGEWRNWAGNQVGYPSSYACPTSVDELSSAITRAAAAGSTVKCVGGGHSFTSIAITDGLQISLDKLAGIDAVDGRLVTVFGGTRLRDLSPELWERGLAMTNLGDIDVQSIAGALSTGTHGTGARFGGIATQVRAIEVVGADGVARTCSADVEPDLFDAARLGLGAVGVISRVTLECDTAFALHAVETPGRLSETLSDLDHHRDSVDHFEFYWFPHTDRVLLKSNTRLPGDTAMQPLGRVRGYVDDELLSNTIFGVVNRVAAGVPRAIPTINSISARALSAREFTDRSYRVFASNRSVKFREMEYAIPADYVADVLGAIDRWLKNSDCRVAFPVEVRFAAADDIWMSTAYGRETAYIAVHQYHRRDHRAYFSAVEAIMRSVGGRPHWGKLHSLGATDFAKLYPRFEDFCDVRDKADPAGVFMNEYLKGALTSV